MLTHPRSTICNLAGIYIYIYKYVCMLYVCCMYLLFPKGFHPSWTPPVFVVIFVEGWKILIPVRFAAAEFPSIPNIASITLGEPEADRSRELDDSVRCLVVVERNSGIG